MALLPYERCAGTDWDGHADRHAEKALPKRKSRYRGTAELSLRRTRDVRLFKKWLHAGGADLLKPTSQYELIRFRCSGGLSIIYVNARGMPTAKTGVAGEAWVAFMAGAEFPYPPSEAGPIRTAAQIDTGASALDGLLTEEVGLTIAEVMTARRCTMGAAVRLLRAVEASGRAVRSGGQPGTAFRWRAPDGPLSPEAPSPTLPRVSEADRSGGASPNAFNTPEKLDDRCHD